MKTRQKPRSDLRSVAQTTVLCHLSNIAQQSGQQIAWDNSKWDLSGKAGKNVEAYSRPYRKPYKLTMNKPSAGM